MGIVARQTIKGSIWSYIGVVIGFITTTYLYTRYLTTEIVGLFGLLLAISTIAGSLSSLGMVGVNNRLFPYFRNKSNGHNGFLLTATIPQIIGFILFIFIFLIFREKLVENNIEKSLLFAEYVDLIIPIAFFYLVFNFFENYLKLLYNAVLGTFLQELVQRVLVLVVVLLYALKIFNLPQLIFGYTIAVCAKAIIIIFYLYNRGELNFKPAFSFVQKELKKEIISVAIYSVIGGLGSLIVFNIDKIVVNQLLDLSNTGVYTIAFYFGTLVMIPSRPLLNITGTLISDAWKENDLKTINDLYYKSCLNQFIIGGFLFLGIWANIDNILVILGPDYAASKWVIFFVGLGYLFDMLTGANGLIIQYSEYYRVALVFIIVLVVIVLILMYSLIPLWGITGAAIAISAALFLNNLMRFVFLFLKYKFQPFNYKFLVVALFYMVLFFILKTIPQQFLLLDIILRGVIISIATLVFFWLAPISIDVQLILMRLKSIFIISKDKK